MKKKDIIISFAVSIVATVAYDAAKKLMPVDKTQFCDIWFFVMILFACMCGKTWFDLHRFKAIMNKITIRGKEYYDIFEEVVYFQVHKSRNRMMIDKLKWDFKFEHNAEHETYMDLSAKWEIFFTANQKCIRGINVGIRGGDLVSEESMRIKVRQEDVEASYQFMREQDDCTYLNVNLNTDVVKKHSGKIVLGYQWEKFIITDRKDDYIYLFPQSLTTGMKQFELVTEHPYECRATVVVLRHKWNGGYDKVEVSETNGPDLRIEIPDEENGKRHRIMINEIDVKNVYLIIFDKNPLAECERN